MFFRLIPIVAIIVGNAVTIFGLGAMMIAIKDRKKENLVAAVVEEQAQV